MSTRLHSRTLTLRNLLAATTCLVAVGTLAGCGRDDSSPDNAADSPTATSSSPTQDTSSASPSATPSASPTEEARLIAYAGGESPGVEVSKPADVTKLKGAPESFKTFIGATVRQLLADSTCSDGFVGITVGVLRTDGYAVGGVNDCGGYAALWAMVDGQWKEIAGTQEAWECKVLEQYQVPSDVVGDTCYDYDAQKERHYEQA